jgi:tight adherence protein C
MPILAVALGALGAAAILLIVTSLVRGSGDPVQARLSKLGTRVQTLEDLELRQPFIDRSLRPLVRRLSGSASRLTTASFASRTATRLATAGSPGDLTVADWLALKVVAAFIGAAFAFLFFLILRAPLATSIIVGATVLGIGYIGPEFWLGERIRARKHRIVKTLPDALDLLTISVRAGLGFDAALAKVVESVKGPLSEEFRRSLAEIRVGKQRRDALRAIIPRTQVPQLTSFIGAILQAEQLGVPIARVLQVQSEQMRIERRQRAEQMAAKAPIKMLFPLVGCILPALFVVILGPALILIAQNLPE